MCFGMFNIGHCCMADGPWDFYFEYPPGKLEPGGATYGTPHLTRTASIYDHPPDTPECAYSLDNWSVEIPNSGKGREFQAKRLAAAIAPSGITSAEVYYAWMNDDGERYWEFEIDFAEDAETLAAVNEVGVDEDDYLGFQWLGTDGNAAGCVEFFVTPAGGWPDPIPRATLLTFRARSELRTWKEWMGFPAGPTMLSVLSAKLVSYDRRVQVDEQVESHSVIVRILDDLDEQVTGVYQPFIPPDGGDYWDRDSYLIQTSLPLSADSGWATVAGEALPREIMSGDIAAPGGPVERDYRDPDTEVAFELEYQLTLLDEAFMDDPAESARLDNLVFELVYDMGEYSGVARVRADLQEVDWIVTDADAFRKGTSVPGVDLITPGRDGQRPIELVDLVELISVYPPQLGAFEPETYYDAVSGSGCGDDLVLSWVLHTRNVITTPAISRVTRVSNGAVTFEDNNFYLNWLDENPVPEGVLAGSWFWNFPEYTYVSCQILGGPYRESFKTWIDPASDEFLDAFNDYYFPVGQSRQANVAVGIDNPSVRGMPLIADEPPPEGEEFNAFQQMLIDGYTATVKVAIGPLEVDDIGLLLIGSPSVIWSFDLDDNHTVDQPVASVNYFDASASASIAVITWVYYTAAAPGGPYTVYHRAVLVIDGDSIPGDSGLLIYHVEDVLGDFGGPTVVVEERAFHPQWLEPRVLHVSEDNSQRFVVFTRRPFDTADADANFSGISLTVRWKLHCYNGATVEWAVESTGLTTVGEVVADPIVHDSSDRFFYLSNFPYSFTEGEGPGFTGEHDEEAPTISGERWRVSHDGTDWLPLDNEYTITIDGGEDPDTTFDVVPGSSSSTIKNSDLLPFAPLAEANHEP